MLLVFALTGADGTATDNGRTGLVLLVQAFRRLRGAPVKILYVGLGVLIVWVVSMAVVGVSASGGPVYITLAWPWHFPIGTAMTFVIGYLVGNRRAD